MRRATFAAALPLAMGVFSGCADPHAAADATLDTAAAECDTPLTWENWGSPFFTTWCQSCHSVDSPNRYGAPDGIDFDTADDIRSWLTAVERTVLEFETMPLGGGLPDDDRALLDEYLCTLR